VEETSFQQPIKDGINLTLILTGRNSIIEYLLELTLKVEKQCFGLL